MIEFQSIELDAKYAEKWHEHQKADPLAASSLQVDLF